MSGTGVHDWAFKVRGKRIRDEAYADSTTRCWRCQRTLAEVKAAFPKRRVKWHAGHVITGDRFSPLLAECSPCNLGDGGKTSLAIRRSSGGTGRF